MATILMSLSGCSSADVGEGSADADGGHSSETQTGGDGALGDGGSGGDFTSGSGASQGTGGDGADSGVALVWPGSRRAAVTLSYDDGLDGQLKYAVPALDARGLRATFFLSSFQGVDHLWSLPNLTDDLMPRHAAWAAVAASGHELGAHTIYHPCDSNNAGFQPQDYSATRMAEELDEANARLGRLGAAPPLSFAYPCAGDTIGIEGGASYMSLVDERYVAARRSTVGVTPADALALHEVSQKFGDEENMQAADLIAYVHEAIDAGGWAVFTFHGIGPEAQCDINTYDLEACALNYLTTQTAEHEALLDALVELEDQVWVAPIKEVAAHLQSLD